MQRPFVEAGEAAKPLRKLPFPVPVGVNARWLEADMGIEVGQDEATIGAVGTRPRPFW